MWQAEQNSGVLDILHDRLGVAIKMRQDHSVGNDARDALALLIDHHRRDTHYEAAVAELCVHALDGVAGRTGQAIAVECAIDLRVRIERSRQHSNRVVAAIAMPQRDRYG